MKLYKKRKKKKNNKKTKPKICYLLYIKKQQQLKSVYFLTCANICNSALYFKQRNGSHSLRHKTIQMTIQEQKLILTLVRFLFFVVEIDLDDVNNYIQ